MSSSHCACRRLNQYDGQKEFWVTIRETGQRTESLTRTKTHTKELEAHRSLH